MILVPTDPFRALLAHCLGSSRPLLDARASHAPESDVKDAKPDSEVNIALPSDLLELIVQHLPRSDHAAARLTCRDMEKLIAPMLRTLFIKDWEISISKVSIFMRLMCVLQLKSRHTYCPTVLLNHGNRLCWSAFAT